MWLDSLKEMSEIAVETDLVPVAASPVAAPMEAPAVLPATETAPVKKEVKMNKDAPSFVPRVNATEFVPKSAQPAMAAGTNPNVAGGNKAGYRDHGLQNDNYQVIHAALFADDISTCSSHTPNHLSQPPYKISR